MKRAMFFFLAFCYNIITQKANSQDVENEIRQIDTNIKAGKTTITNVLTSDSLMHLHSLTPFREVIKANAKAEKITIVSNGEPGARITISGSVINKNAEPQKNVTIYFYQTSSKGWYADTGVHVLMNSGDMKHARLFGYLKTDDKGKFVFETIKPSGYPKSDLAAHIHIHMWDEKGNSLNTSGELQFDDDERMTEGRRKRSLQEGYLISKNSGTQLKPVYNYTLIVQ